jgi:hypothetical protein
MIRFALFKQDFLAQGLPSECKFLERSVRVHQHHLPDDDDVDVGEWLSLIIDEVSAVDDL